MRSGRGGDARKRPDHYATLFPRQNRLDLDAPAAADDAPVDEGDAPARSAVDAHGEPFTWSEQHRRECEARHVMKLALEQRRTYYQHVAEIRGETAARELVAEVKRQWAIVNAI